MDPKDPPFDTLGRGKIPHQRVKTEKLDRRPSRKGEANVQGELT